MVCKASEAYASSQATKVTRVRDGQHMINQLQDVTSDLSRQREKILAVYDAREVQRSADRLGETLKAVCDLVGDLESTAVMFGKKRGFGKTVSALVHDIGTNANALLAATSLAIADRYLTHDIVLLTSCIFVVLLGVANCALNKVHICHLRKYELCMATLEGRRLSHKKRACYSRVCDRSSGLQSKSAPRCRTKNDDDACCRKVSPRDTFSIDEQPSAHCPRC